MAVAKSNPAATTTGSASEVVGKDTVSYTHLTLPTKA